MARWNQCTNWDEFCVPYWIAQDDLKKKIWPQTPSRTPLTYLPTFRLPAYAPKRPSLSPTYLLSSQLPTYLYTYLQASLVCRFAKNRGRYLQMTRRRIYKLIFCFIKTRHSARSAPVGVDDLMRRCKVWCGCNLLSAPQNRSDRHATQGQDTMAARARAQVCVKDC